MNAKLRTTRFAGFIAALFAAEAGFAQTSLSIGTVPGYPGTTVQVPVALRQAPSSTVAAQLDVAFNPAKVSALEALRGERLSNLAEFARGLNPLSADTDGDGWDDATEILDGTDPLNPSSGARATVGSPQVAYFNGLLDLPPASVTWSIFSPTVSFFNGLPEPGPTNAFLFSPIVSYENQ